LQRFSPGRKLKRGSIFSARHSALLLQSRELAALIGRFVDCRSHAPYEGTAFVQHGESRPETPYRKAVWKRKMNRSPSFWRVSDPGSKGTDEADFSFVSVSAMIAHINLL
jgi:hypothetical protein